MYVWFSVNFEPDTAPQNRRTVRLKTRQLTTQSVNERITNCAVCMLTNELH